MENSNSRSEGVQNVRVGGALYGLCMGLARRRRMEGFGLPYLYGVGISRLTITALCPRHEPQHETQQPPKPATSLLRALGPGVSK